MLITFEGLDYCGKTTQAQLLVEQFKQFGKDVLFIREPGGTSISEKIRAILLDKQHNELTQKAELFLFSAARTQLVSEVIRPALEARKIVVCDRFYDSTTAYQGYGRNLNLAEVLAVNKIAIDGIVPDLTIFVDIEIDEIFKRQEAAGVLADRMESSGREFFKKVRDGYWMLAQEVSERFVIVNGKRPVDIIHNEIWHVIEKRII
ncbi:MAG: dTMP kinase [Bacteroidota bacterium]|nr:dTMP kinase [Bacteroidota bacterium]